MGKGQGPAAAPENLGGTAIKPVGWDRTGLEAFKYLLYNPDTGEVLTRTPLSWLKITAFYIVYYSCLAAFWVGCLNIFFLTLPENQMGPKWTMDQSIIGTNPGKISTQLLWSGYIFYCVTRRLYCKVISCIAHRK